MSPNQLTIIRLGLTPALWVLAILGQTFWLGAGVALAALTDVIDGPLARRTGRASARGSRLDSIADHLLTASLAIWLIWLRPDFVAERAPLLATWIIFGAAVLLFGWVKFGRIGDLHLYSAKAAGTLGYLFAIGLLMFGTYSRALFYVVITFCFVASAETLIVFWSRSSVDEHIGSILTRKRSRRRPFG